MIKRTWTHRMRMVKTIRKMSTSTSTTVARLSFPPTTYVQQPFLILGVLGLDGPSPKCPDQATDGRTRARRPLTSRKRGRSPQGAPVSRGHRCSALRRAAPARQDADNFRKNSRQLQYRAEVQNRGRASTRDPITPVRRQKGGGRWVTKARAQGPRWAKLAKPHSKASRRVQRGHEVWACADQTYNLPRRRKRWQPRKGQETARSAHQLDERRDQAS